MSKKCCEDKHVDLLLIEEEGKKLLYVACSYGYELVCVDDKFRKPFKLYLGEDAVCNFINSMIEESKYCSEVMKKPFNKELVMTKKDIEDFKNSANVGV